MPKWVLIAKSERGDWQLLASVSTIREVQSILKFMIGVESARLVRLDPESMIDLDAQGEWHGIRQLQGE